MRKVRSKKVISIVLVICLAFITAITGFTVDYFRNSKLLSSSDTGVTIYYESTSGTPNIYYWNSNPNNLEIEWPGVAMVKDEYQEGGNWYKYSFKDVNKINMLFYNNGQQTADLTRNTGTWWYKDNKWYSYNPYITPPSTSEDFREESIYFVITTRFYDGDPSNNVHCWDDETAGNPDSDPAWRGDFKGLIEKLDYIKALGFSAIWITPVVENASGYDYHGYHAINFSKVDPRYESEGATYQDLINACHEKGIKVIQDIVLNHTSNNGEENLFPIMSKDNKLNSGVSGNYSNAVKNDINGVLPSNYDSLNPTLQYQSRDAAMKSGDLIYRKNVDINYEGFTVTTGQFASDCMELNTENPTVYNYLVDCYNKYIDMGVDAFRIDTTKHISRLTFNNVFLPAFKAKAEANGNNNFYMFGEVAARVHDMWNHNNPNVTPCFYTWKENKTYPWNNNSVDGKDNVASCEQLYKDNENVATQRTSDNAFLNGNNYHTPDYSENSGLAVIDYAMHFNFRDARSAFSMALQEDSYFNDATWGVTYVDSHDYGPSVDGSDENRYNGGTQAWAENLNLLFTFRGIPCLYYGSEIEFMKGAPIDVGPTAPLSTTGRAYFGDNIEGSVNVTDFAQYTNATGAMADTLNNPLAKHIQRLNLIRRAVPALQKGQYSTEGVSGDAMAFKRRYTADGVDSFVCVAISGSATFTGIPSGTYVDAITGKTITCNGTLTTESVGKGNMRVYVLKNSSGISDKIGEDGEYLK